MAPSPDRALRTVRSRGRPCSRLPFGIQSDALANIKAYDARVDSLYKSLEDTFHQFDRDNSGEVDWKEFKAAMTEMVQKQVRCFTPTTVISTRTCRLLPFVRVFAVPQCF